MGDAGSGFARGRGRAFATWVACVLCVAGCSSDLAGKLLSPQLQSTLNSAVVVGHVGHRTGDRLTVVVVSFREEAGGLRAEDSTHVFGAAQYTLNVVAGEKYTILAFADRNGNFRFDLDEPIGLSRVDPRGGPAGRLIRSDLDLAPRKSVPAKYVEALGSIARLERRPASLELGTIAGLDDDRFSPEVGSRGLWDPDRFLASVGAGVFFLEPFDASKTPVLFVSGAGGFPRQWGPLVERLDRERFQPWVFLYPSGVRLDRSVRLLGECMQQLRQRYGFSPVDVVAHSMGGLIAREWILREKEASGSAGVGRFISISTPWRGHEAAALGADLPGGPVAAWADLRTDSAFQTAMFARPLPDEVRYSLLYSFGGKKNPLLPDNDGAVTVASQLREEAKADAALVRGFDAGHGEILVRKDLADVIRRILDAGTDQTSQVSTVAPSWSRP